MNETEASLDDQKYRYSYLGQPTTRISESEKKCSTGFLLESCEERAALLKAGSTVKDIESEYIRQNGITVISVNWQD